MAFWRWAFEGVGGFDKEYRKAGDDVDFCWRLQSNGGAVAFSPSANHLMLMQLKQPLKQGGEFHGTLTFEKSGTIEIHFAVESMGAQGPEEESDAD